MQIRMKSVSRYPQAFHVPRHAPAPPHPQPYNTHTHHALIYSKSELDSCDYMIVWSKYILLHINKPQPNEYDKMRSREGISAAVVANIVIIIVIGIALSW